MLDSGSNLLTCLWSVQALPSRLARQLGQSGAHLPSAGISSMSMLHHVAPVDKSQARPQDCDRSWQVRHRGREPRRPMNRTSPNLHRKSDQQFVDGELEVSGKLSTLQMSTEAEFRTDSNWQEIGGSEQAARYVQPVDEHRTFVALLHSQLQ